LAFMMLDADIYAVSTSSLFRVLLMAGLLRKWSREKSGKANGFVGPTRPHEHCHIDTAYLNISSTFFIFTSQSTDHDSEPIIGDEHNVHSDNAEALLFNRRPGMSDSTRLVLVAKQLDCGILPGGRRGRNSGLNK